MTADDIGGLLPGLGSAACEKLLAQSRNEGLYTPPSTRGTIVYPMTGGGVNWGSAAFDPVNQILLEVVLLEIDESRLFVTTFG